MINIFHILVPASLFGFLGGVGMSGEHGSMNFMGGFVMFFLIACLYLTPSVIALVRKTTNGNTVFWMNLLLSWTVFMYVVTLVMALSGTSKDSEERDSMRAGALFAQGMEGASASASQSSRADELAKLAQLKNDGVLSEEEFQQQKAKLLG